MSADYHKYLIDFENRKIIGDFDAAYRNCDDVYPTQHDVRTPKHRIIRSLIAEMDGPLRLLDVGCGYGDFTADLVNDFDVDGTGIDISDAAIRKGRERFDNGVQLEVGDLEQGLRWDDEAFDVVLCLGVVAYYLDRLDVLFAELVRVTRAGGTLVVSAYVPPNPIGGDQVGDYAALLRVAGRYLDVEQLLRVYDPSEIFKGQPLDACPDDLVIFGRARS
ncbi:MAG: class I SAM-dependent methyltransferase [Candidatus Nanopelagicales bacterium]